MDSMRQTASLKRELSPELIAGSIKLSSMLIGLVILISMISSAGWVFENQELKTLFLGKTNLLRSSISLSFLICSFSLFFSSKAVGKGFKYYCGLFLALIMITASGATLYEGLSASDLSLDWQLYSPSEEAAGLSFPGPMPANVSLNFIFLSLALASINLSGPRLSWLWQISALVSLILALTAFFGFLCGVDSLCTMFGCVRMPVTISLPFTLLSTACFCAKPDANSTKIFVTDSLGGRIARRFLVFMLAIPVSIAIRYVGCAIKLYDNAFGWAVFGVLVFASLIAVIIWSARTLDIIDGAREHALNKHAEAEQKVEVAERKLVSEIAKQAAGITAQEISFRNICLECMKEFPLNLDRCPADNARLSQLPDDSLIGTTFAEKFYVLEELGSGGMATVYKARHLFLDHQVFAVKVLNKQFATDPTTVKRFQHEAKTASRLSHKNLLRIHDFGISRTGQPYLLMDLIKGQSLKDVLYQCHRLDIQQFEEIFSQVLDGIAYAHENGVVHRDLKPANIMLVENDDGSQQALIVDFGIAKANDGVDMQLTKTGEVFGSPLYMSPEQWEGKKVDQRSDIYALGCVMYESLAGQPPFVKETLFEVLNAHLNEEVPDMAGALRIAGSLQEVLKKCLAKKPQERPADARALKAALFSKSPFVL